MKLQPWALLPPAFALLAWFAWPLDAPVAVGLALIGLLGLGLSTPNALDHA